MCLSWLTSTHAKFRGKKGKDFSEIRSCGSARACCTVPGGCAPKRQSQVNRRRCWCLYSEQEARLCSASIRDTGCPTRRASTGWCNRLCRFFQQADGFFLSGHGHIKLASLGVGGGKCVEVTRVRAAGRVDRLFGKPDGVGSVADFRIRDRLPGADPERSAPRPIRVLPLCDTISRLQTV